MRSDRSDIPQSLQLRDSAPFKIELLHRSSTPPPAASTLPPKRVFHEVQSLLQTVTKFITTEDELLGFKARFDSIRCVISILGFFHSQIANSNFWYFSGALIEQGIHSDLSMQIRDPLPIKSKGRPRSTRLRNSALEGTQRGGSRQRRGNLNTISSSSQILPPSNIQSGSSTASSAQARRRRCRRCGEEGHYITTCHSAANA